MKPNRIVAVGLWAALLGGCSKGTDPDKPAGIPPLPVAAPRPPSGTPALPAAARLPAPTAAASEALAGALGMRGPDEGEAEAIPDTSDEKHTISGTIVLPAANRTKVARGDVMFLAARRTGGPPGPGSMLAVQKLVAEGFPMRFSINSRDAMIPGVPFEGPVAITVRVDKDGDAMTRRKGDLFGQADNVAVGSQKVVITLDKVQAEDRTLGEPGPALGGALPPGPP